MQAGRHRCPHALRCPRHCATTADPANRTVQSRSRSPRCRDGPALCCARPGMGMTHGGGSAPEMLLIAGALSGPPWSSGRHRSRGCSGTFEDHLRGTVQSECLEPESLMTFGAAFPDAFRPMPPGVAAGLPLLGLSTIAPPSYGVVESTPGSALAGLTFGSEQPAPIMFRPRGFAPPRRLSPPTNLLGFEARLPTMGFAAFPAPAKSLSRDAPPPFRALLPRCSAARNVAVSHFGQRSVRFDTSPCRLDFTRCLASSSLRDGTGSRRCPTRSTSRPSAAPGAVPPDHVAATCQPLLSWACPSRADPTEAAPMWMGERQRPLRESGSRS